MKTSEFSQRVKIFFGHVGLFFQNMFGDIRTFIDKQLPDVINFMNAVKEAVNNPAVDIITALTPSNVDNAVVEQIRKHLGAVIDLLQIKVPAKIKDDNEAKIAFYIEYLRKQSPEVQKALFARTASLLAKLHCVDAKRFTGSEIDTLIQIAYTKLKHQPTA